MASKEFEAVVFDIDGTLTPGVSWFVLTEGLGASVDEHSKIYSLMREGELSLREAEKEILRMWQTTGNANKTFIKSLFESQVIHSEAELSITNLKEKGYLVCLISGAVDLYVEVMAERLGVDYYFSNSELVWDDEGNLVDFHYDADQGEKKLKQLVSFLREQGIDSSKCAVVGDSWNDKEIFLHTGRGIMIHTPVEDESLREHAWREINDLSELGDIL